MKSFLFVYRSPRDYTPGRPETFAAWEGWFKSMGASLADFGNPVFERHTLGRTADDTVLGGYSLINADDLDAAIAIAQGCPHIGEGGGVEVGELTPLDRQTPSPATAEGAHSAA
jgi:YCII-related domain